MSESTPEPIAKSEADTPGGLHRTSLSHRPERRRPAWLLLSLLVHGLVVGVSVVVVVRETDDAPTRKEDRTMAAERVEKVSEQIRDINADELRANVIALLAIKQAMDTILRSDGRVYADFANEQIQRDPAVAQAQLDEAARAVAAASEAGGPLATVRAEIARLASTTDGSANAAKLETLEAEEKRLRRQLNEGLGVAEAAMATAYAELGWIASPELVAQQSDLVAQLTEARARANASHQAYDSMRYRQRDLGKDADKVADAQRRVAAAKERVSDGKALVKTKRDEFDKAKAIEDAAKVETAQAGAAYEFAQKALTDGRAANVDVEARKTLERALDLARKAKADAENAEKSAARNLGSADRALKSAESELAKRHIPAVGREEGTLAAREKDLAKRQGQIKEAFDDMTASGQDATERSAAVAADARAITTEATTYFLTATPQPVEAPAIQPSYAGPGDVYDMNFAELYTTADELEAQIVVEYRTIRGVRLSMLRAMALESAILLIDTPKPDRLEIADELLTGSPRTAAGLEKQKTAIRNALSEGDRMEAYCLALLESLRVDMEDLAITVDESPETTESTTDASTSETADSQTSDQSLADVLAQIANSVKAAIDAGEDAQDSIDRAVETANDAHLDPSVTDHLKAELEKAADDAIVTATTPADPEPTVDPESTTDPEAATDPVSTTEPEHATDPETTNEPATDSTVSTTPDAPQSTEERKAAEEARKTAAADAQSEAKTAMKAATDSVFSAVLADAQHSDGADSANADAQSNMAARLAKTRAMEVASSETTARVVDLSGLMKANPSDLKQAMDAAAQSGAPAGQSGGMNMKVAPGAAGSITKELLLDYIKMPGEAPPLDQKTEGLLWGRKISREDGTPASWLVIDSWYVIGPWDNPNRANRDRKFPPENVIDLDATYLGRDNSPLKWQYIQATEAWNAANVVPPNPTAYAIYYFYTEVHVDEAMDLWIATGSDDKSKIWLNDLLIWESGPWHKNWRVNEGFRKVHFKAGRNRILYRLENGHGGTAMSMLIRTAPWEDAPAP